MISDENVQKAKEAYKVGDYIKTINLLEKEESFDNESKEIRMASVYRDTLLEQMDMDYHKANQAYF